jgi:hypothetical protein
MQQKSKELQEYTSRFDLFYGKKKTHRLVLWDAIPCKEFHDVVAYSYGSCLSRENNKSTTSPL